MRPIVALHEDGNMAGWFESMALAQRLYGIPRDAIWRSIKTGKPYKGFRWVYKEVYEYHYRQCTLHQLAYAKDNQRDIKGHWVKGHLGIKHTENTKKNIAEIARKQSIRQANDPNSKWGKGQQKRVWCVNNNKEYASMTEAANELGLTQHQISVAINGNHKTKGYKFYKVI